MNEINTTPEAAVDAKADAIHNLRTFHRAARDIGLSFVLMDGTLLGAYRDQDFCEGDEDDIDVGVVSDDFERVSELERILEAQGFSADHFIYRDRIEGVKLARGASHVDVVRISHHPELPECYNLGRVVRKRNGSNVADVLAFVYPEHHHAGTDRLKFQGMTFRVPADPEGFLTVRYGDWRTKVTRAAGFNWYEQGRASIRNEYPPII